MKTPSHHSQTPPEEPVEAISDEEQEDSLVPVSETAESDTSETTDDEDLTVWRSMESAPRDQVIEGQIFEDQERGIAMRWRVSRHRSGHSWVIGGVWHDATTPGAVQVHPLAWRPWVPVTLHFETPQEPDAA